MLKTLIVSILFPTWIWTKDSSKKFLSASRSYDLAIQFNKKRRDIITSDLYQRLWPTKLKTDSNRSDYFENVSGGFMKSVSALGMVTGIGGDYLLSDDLFDVMTVFSKTKRDQVRHWYQQAFYNRVQDKKTAIRINVNQRTHSRDISNLLKELDFKSLILPMVKEEKNLSTIEINDPRNIGELLHIERYGEKELLDNKKNLGAYAWSSQYQQSPIPIGGEIIKKEWLRYFRGSEKNNFEKLLILGDLSFKGSVESDYNVFSCIGTIGRDIYLLDIIRGKWSYVQAKENFKEFCKKYPSAKKYIEDKANGSALISDLSDEVGYIYPWPSKNSSYASIGKVERLMLCQQTFEIGNFYINEELEIKNIIIDELCGMTENGNTTGNDDIVDTVTMGMLECKKSRSFSVA